MCRIGNHIASLEKKPPQIPNAPDQKYKAQWSSWGDWLGTGRIATHQRQYLPFEEAREFVRSLGLKSQAEWRQYANAKNGAKPDNIPYKPERTYKDDWKGMGDWLGTGTLAPKDRVYRSFEDARSFVRTLRLQSSKEWSQFCKSESKPNDIPNAPNQVYSDEWVSMGDWLGTGVTATFLREYMPFEQAREYARKQGLTTGREWQEWCQRHQPKDIPHAPFQVYSEWISMADWLGVEEYQERRAKERLEAEPQLTSRQIEIITGSLLGDATLTKVGVISEKHSWANSCFTVAHSEKQKGYVEWMYREMIPVSREITTRLSKSTVIDGRTTSGGVPTYYLETQRHSVLTEMERKWYSRDDDGNYVYRISNGKKYRIKTVPMDLELTPLATAIWFFDDGYIRTPERNLWICTQSFSWDECEFLACQLHRLGISDAWVEWKHKKAKKHPLIHIGCRSFMDFVEMVRQFLPSDDLAYKVDTSGWTEPKFTKIRDSDESEILRLNDLGYNCSQIAEALGFTTTTTVSTVLKRRKGIKGRINNSSGIVGVGRSGTRWKAEIVVGGKCLHLGNYKSKSHAISIRGDAEKMRSSGIMEISNYLELREAYAVFRDPPGRTTRSSTARSVA